MASLRAYLAGPEVFLPNAAEVGEAKKRLCEQYGVLGVFPLDTELADQGRELGLAISAANEQLIRSSDLVIANMTPFRGPSADVGTAYEMGFARALGLPVFAYTNDPERFQQRTRQFLSSLGELRADEERDAHDMSIEAFELSDNLMLAGALREQGYEPTHGHTDRAQRFVDLDAFERCLALAASRVRGN
jgi:nucleoside 2-deoxyribosyltransferase